MKTVQNIVRNVPPHWVGDGFPVRSLFSYHEGNQFYPFLLLDYAGPHRFEPVQTPRGVGEQPLGEPVVGQGPFVMNTQLEIRQAMMDFQAGRMGRL